MDVGRIGVEAAAMSVELFETGLSQIAGGLAALCAPTSNSIEQLARDLEGIDFSASQLGRADLVASAREAEVATRALLAGTVDAHVPCVQALHRLGNLLLLAFVQLAETRSVFVESRRRLERKILVVDDSRVAAIALSNAFVARDFLVRSVTTMEEALAELSSFAPTILVSDVHMPNLDVGILCRNFRVLSEGRPTRVVLVSATTGEELQGRLDEVKPDAFVSKMSGTATVIARVIEIWDALNS